MGGGKQMIPLWALLVTLIAPFLCAVFLMYAIVKDGVKGDIELLGKALTLFYLSISFSLLMLVTMDVFVFNL
jgi:hypothetical protein